MKAELWNDPESFRETTAS